MFIGRTIAALALATCALALVPIAAAHNTSISSTIEITGFPNVDKDFDQDGVEGVVTSPKAACERRRTVKLFWIGNPDHPKSSLILIDTVRTNRDGEWRGGDVEPIGHGGKAVVTRKNVGPRGHRHVCKADTDTYD